MSRIFLTSDTHFGHDRAFLWSPRGFGNIKEHDEAIIKNWNSEITCDDEVYHLGDVMLGNNDYGMECLSKLNGQIKIIVGNHDTDTRIKLYETLPNVEILGWAYPLKYKKYHFLLSHHPTMTSNLEKAPYLRMHLINLYGHTHQKTNFYNDIPFMFHVGMDSHNCAPILLDDAIEMMKKETQKCLDLCGEGQIVDADEPAAASPIAELTPVETFVRPIPVAGGCDKCAHQGQCSGWVKNIRCKYYEKDPIDGGFY